MVCFFRKMCKWITNWEKRFKDDKRIYFYPVIGYMYILKSKKNNKTIYTTYKLCLGCKKMKVYNEMLISPSVYNYRCKECEIVEDDEKGEDYKKILLIDTSKEYILNEKSLGLSAFLVKAIIPIIVLIIPLIIVTTILITLLINTGFQIHSFLKKYKIQFN